MQIIGFNLTKILVERKEKFEGKLDIAENIDIKNVSKENVPISSEEVLKIDFNFQVNYSNNFAKLEFSGNLLIVPEKSELKELLKSWKDRKISDDLKVPLFNFIMSKCNVKALFLEDELNLPHHIPLPRVEPPKK